MSLNTSYKFIDRQSKTTCLYLSGWGFPVDVFNFSETSNCINILHYTPTQFLQDFSAILKECKVQHVDIIGFSLGGYVGLECLSNFPEVISSVSFYGARPVYESSDVDLLLSNLLKNQKATLKHFFKQCFFNITEFRLFYSQYEEQCLSLYSQDDLVSGLQYLKKQRLMDWCKQHLQLLSCVTFYHGEHDLIAQLEEIQSLKEAFSAIDLRVIQQKGHVVFDM